MGKLKIRDNNDNINIQSDNRNINVQSDNRKETVCVVRTPEGRAAEKRRGKKEDLLGYVVFSILSLLCSAGSFYLLEMVMMFKLLILIPAGLSLVFAIAAKSRRSGVMSIMALVFSIIAVIVVCSVTVACVCVDSFVNEARTEYVEPFTENFTGKLREALPWFFD